MGELLSRTEQSGKRVGSVWEKSGPEKSEKRVGKEWEICGKCVKRDCEKNVKRV